MTVNNTTQRLLVVFKLPRPVPALLVMARVILDRMTGNPALPSPVPTLAVLSQAIDDLQAAQVQACRRTVGAVAGRNAKKTALVGLLLWLAQYIQSVADADRANAAWIIQGAGACVKKEPQHAPRVFVAKPGRVPGVVVLVAPSAGPRSAYIWQYSTDGGVTWTTLPVTVQATTSVAGLTVRTTVLFRYRVASKDGEGNWSPVVSLFVQ